MDGGTQTITMGEGRAYGFVAVDHANSEVVGIHAARSAIRFEALEPVRQGCMGASEPLRPRGAWIEAASRSWLQLPYLAIQDEIECLGIEASPSFV